MTTYEDFLRRKSMEQRYNAPAQTVAPAANAVLRSRVAPFVPALAPQLHANQVNQPTLEYLARNLITSSFPQFAGRHVDPSYMPSLLGLAAANNYQPQAPPAPPPPQRPQFQVPPVQTKDRNLSAYYDYPELTPALAEDYSQWAAPPEYTTQAENRAEMLAGLSRSGMAPAAPENRPKSIGVAKSKEEEAAVKAMEEYEASQQAGAQDAERRMAEAQMVMSDPYATPEQKQRAQEAYKVAQEEYTGYLQSSPTMNPLAIFDIPMEYNQDWISQWAYDRAVGNDTTGMDDRAKQISAGLTSLMQTGLTLGYISPDETFYSWATNDENQARIKAVYENGYGEYRPVDTDGDGIPDAEVRPYYGAEAVWQLYQSDNSAFERGIADITTDPLVTLAAPAGALGWGGRKLSTRGLENAAARGMTPGVSAQIIGGGLLQAPGKTLALADYPLEAAIKRLGVLGRGFTDDSIRAMEQEAIEDTGALVGRIAPNQAAPPTSPHGPVPPSSVIPPSGGPPLMPGPRIVPPQPPPPSSVAPPPSSGPSPAAQWWIQQMQARPAPAQAAPSPTQMAGNFWGIQTSPTPANLPQRGMPPPTAAIPTPPAGPRQIPLEAAPTPQQAVPQPPTRPDVPTTPALTQPQPGGAAYVPTKEQWFEDLKGGTKSVSDPRLGGGRIVDDAWEQAQINPDAGRRFYEEMTVVKKELDDESAAIAGDKSFAYNDAVDPPKKAQYDRTAAGGTKHVPVEKQVKEALPQYEYAVTSAEAYVDNFGRPLPKDAYVTKSMPKSPSEAWLRFNPTAVVQRAIFGNTEEAASAFAYMGRTWRGTDWGNETIARIQDLRNRYKVARDFVPEQAAPAPKADVPTSVVTPESAAARELPQPKTAELPQMARDTGSYTVEQPFKGQSTLPNNRTLTPQAKKTLADAGVLDRDPATRRMAGESEEQYSIRKAGYRNDPSNHILSRAYAQDSLDDARRLLNTYGEGLYGPPQDAARMGRKQKDGWRRVNNLIAEAERNWDRAQQALGRGPTSPPENVTPNVTQESLTTPQVQGAPPSGDAVGISPLGDIQRQVQADIDARPVPSGDMPSLSRSPQTGQPDPRVEAAVRNGDIDRDEAEFFQQRIDWGNDNLTVLQVWEREMKAPDADPQEIAHRVAEAMREQGLSLYEGGRARQLLKSATPKSRAARAAGTPSQMFRENVMYNIVSGPAATMRDAISNAFYIAALLDPRLGMKTLARTFNPSSGTLRRGFTTANVRKEYGAVWERLGLGTVPSEFVEAFNKAAITGDEGGLILPTAARKAVAKLGAGETTQKAVGKAFGTFASDVIRNRRVGVDVIGRVIAGEGRLIHHIGNARLDYLNYIRNRLMRTGLSKDELDQAMGLLVELGDKRGSTRLFNNRDLLAAFDQINTLLGREAIPSGDATHFARTWTNWTRKANAAAKEDVRKTLFSYKQTKTDDALSKVLVFHYWQSRAVGNTARALAKNPWMARVGYEMQQWFSETSDMEGLPPWTRGLLKFFGDGGTFMAFLDPINAVIPYAQFREMALMDGEERDFDEWAQALGISPLVQSALTAIGWFSPYQAPNILGTNAVFQAATAIADVSRNYILPEWFDNTEYLGLSDELNVPQVVFNELFEAVNGNLDALAERLGMGGAVKPVEFIKVGSSRVRRTREIVETLYMEQQGITSMDQLTADDYANIAAIIDSEDTDEPHPLMVQALQMETANLAGRRIFNTISPLPAITAYGPQMERGAIRYGDATATEAEQDAAFSLADIARAADPDFVAQVEGASLAGTEQGRKDYGAYNAIVYGNEQEFVERHGPMAVINVGPTGFMFAHDWFSLSIDERKAMLEAEQPEFVKSVDAQRKAKDDYEEANPGYATYQSWIDDYKDLNDGDIIKTRDQMMAASPGYAKYIGRQNPTVRDRFGVIFSPEAYKAWMGEDWTIYRDAPPKSQAAATTDLLAAMVADKTVQSQGGGSGGKTPTEQAAAFKEKVAEYEMELDLYNKAVATLTGGVDPSQLHPMWAQSLGENPQVAALDTPRKPAGYDDYLNWKMWMEGTDPEADTSIDAYFAWKQEVKDQAA